MMCPLKNSATNIELKCGKQYIYEHDGWETTTWVPDDRCKFEEVG